MFPVLVGIIVKIVERARARVVNQNVDAAILLHTFFHTRLAIMPPWSGHRAGNAHGRPSFSMSALISETSSVKCGINRSGAGLGECHGVGHAEALIRAGDHRHLAIQAEPVHAEAYPTDST